MPIVFMTDKHDPLTLGLNDRTREVPLLKMVDDVLTSYNNQQVVDVKDFFLEDCFPAFSKLAPILNVSKDTTDPFMAFKKYSTFELRMIANEVYSLKGDVQAILEFASHFDIRVLRLSDTFDIDLVVDFEKVVCDDPEYIRSLFLDLFKELELFNKVHFNVWINVIRAQVNNEITVFRNAQYLQYHQMEVEE